MAILHVLSLTLASGILQASPVTPQQAQDPTQQPAAAAIAAPRMETRNAAPAPDRQVCRRHVRIGTLAGFESICHTEAEWRAIAAGTQSSYQQLQGTLGSTNHRVSTNLRDSNGPF